MDNSPTMNIYSCENHPPNGPGVDFSWLCKKLLVMWVTCLVSRISMNVPISLLTSFSDSLFA